MVVQFVGIELFIVISCKSFVVVVSSLSFLILQISVQFSRSVMSDSLQFGPFYSDSFIDLDPLFFLMSLAKDF